MSEWQLVKTGFPRGEVVLIYGAKFGVALGYFITGQGWQFPDERNKGLRISPSHWMYLPEPPK